MKNKNGANQFNKKHLKYYVCPLCKSDLKLVKCKKLFCVSCKKNYDIINGIPFFLDIKTNPSNFEKQNGYFSKEYSKKISLVEPWQKSYLDRMDCAFASKKKQRFFLDVGCGSGYAVLHFAEKGMISFGLDLSINSIMRLKKIALDRRLDNVVLCVASAEFLPYKEDLFEYVSSNAVIEHLPNDVKFVEELLRISKMNSTYFLTVPIKFRYLNPLFWIPNLIHDKMIGHLRRYNLKRMIGLFKKRAILTKLYYTGHFIKSLITGLNMLSYNRKRAKFAEKLDKLSINNHLWANNMSVVFRRIK